MKYLKEKHMICIEKEESQLLYKDMKSSELIKALMERGYNLIDLIEDKSKVQEILTEVHSKISNNKEELEIFASVFCYLEFYPPGSKVCFVLKDSINPSSLSVKSFSDLIKVIKEYTITDFGIFSEDGLREFQLKQFKGEPTTNELFKYINKVLKKYGYNLGSTNLLLVLQSEDSDLSGIDFQKLNDCLRGLEIQSKSDILVSYNEENKVNVINTVYPSLGTSRVPITWQRVM